MLCRILSGIVLILCLSDVALAQGWRDLFKQASATAREGQADSAVVIAQLAFDAAVSEFGDQDTVTSKVHYNLGIFQSRASDNPAAERSFRNALSIGREKFPVDHPMMGRIVNALGLALKYQGQYDQAEPLYREALKLKTVALGPDDPEVANSLNNLAQIQLLRGSHDDAEQSLRRVLEIRKKALGESDEATIRGQARLGNLLRDRGKYLEAERLLSEAADNARQFLDTSAVDRAEAEFSVGLLYRDYGRFGKAAEHISQATLVWERLGEVDYPNGVLELGVTLWQAGDFLEAERQLYRSLQLSEEIMGEDHPDRFRYWLWLANLHHDMGIHRKAETEYQQAIRLAEIALGPNHHDLASAINSFAVHLIRTGQPKGADSLLSRALTIMRNSYGEEHGIVATTLETVAEMHLATGDVDAAEKALSKAEGIWLRQTQDVPLAMATNQRWRAEAALAKGQYDCADSLLGLVEQTYQDHTGLWHPDLAACLEMRGGISLQRGKPADALVPLQRAFEIRSKNLGRALSILPEQDALDHAARLSCCADQYLMAILESSNLGTWKDNAIGVVVTAKGIVTDATLRRRQQWQLESDSEQQRMITELQGAYRALSEHYLGLAEDTAQNRTILDSLAKQIDRQESDLAHAGVNKVSPSNPEEPVVGQTELLIDYYRIDPSSRRDENAPGRYVAAVYTGDGDRRFVDLGDAQLVDSAVAEYRRHLQIVATFGEATGTDREQYIEIGRRLYDLVLWPVEDLILPGLRIVISPDASLNLVAFGSLVDSSGRYVVENHSLLYVSAGRDLARQNAAVRSGSGLLALGDPDFDAAAGSRLAAMSDPTPDRPDDRQFSEPVLRGSRWLETMTASPLPRTRDEVEEIATRFAQATGETVVTLLGAAASEDQLAAKAPGKRLLHLATHGYFRPHTNAKFSPATIVSPLLSSGLLLAGANRQDGPAHGIADGILTAYEACMLDLRGVELVVLSACETGLGSIHDGEGVFGLRRAFRMAGAQAVVSALWAVPDQSTAAMMQALYLQEDSTDLADRMRQVQLELLHSLRESSSPDHPFSWAAFAATGGR